jgi:oxygen-independent coproporphyrinogen-3 oxidase
LLTQITTSHRLGSSGASPARTVDELPIPLNEAIRSLYIHVPFCFHKCHYCDFYSLVDRRERQDAFIDRLLDEFAAAANVLKWPLQTVFVGGGTPTLLSEAQWKRILDRMRDSFAFEAGCEFTIEANPETLTNKLAQTLRFGGVNRISIGCQSFNPAHLKTLERWHEPENVARSVTIARAAGFGSINLDLMFAIPGQTLDEWAADLSAAIALNPQHLSCYILTFEPNTPLHARMLAGEIQPAPEDLQAEMYELTCSMLQEAGFEQYEISNFARPGRACRHNLAYWRNENWWAIGPGGSGHVGGVRWKNVPSLDRYLETSSWAPVTDVEVADADCRIGETFMLGLRQIAGMEDSDVDRLLQHGKRAAARAAAIHRHVSAGLLERIGGRLRLSPRGRLLADSVLVDLL